MNLAHAAEISPQSRHTDASWKPYEDTMPQTIPQRLIELTERAPERECIRLITPDEQDTVITRGGLMQRAAHTAARLAEAGAGGGDLVIIVQADLETLVSTFYGAMLLGAIPSILPFATEKLHPDRYRDAISRLIQIARPRVLAVDPGIEAEVWALLPDETDDLHLPDVVVMTMGGFERAEVPVDLPDDAEAIALLQHSSGTTGLQKGVALSHRAIFDQLDAYAKSLAFTAGDVIVSWLPLYHDMGLIAGYLMPVLFNARLVLMSPFAWVRQPGLLFHAITEQQGTLCWLPNFAYNFTAQKLRERHLEGVDLRSIRAFVNCSEPVYASSHALFAERFAPFGASENQLTACYAMAETVFAVTQTPLGQPASVDVIDGKRLVSDNHAVPVEADHPHARQVVSSGLPIDGMAIRIVDDDHTLLDERAVGNIEVKSVYMLTGYYERPDLADQAFFDGWYQTGDMGYVVDEQVYVLGRKKDLIIVGGKNIHPTDVEAVVNRVEGVYPGRVAAFGVVNERAGTEDLGVVAETTADEDEHNAIKKAIRQAVASHTDATVSHLWLVPHGWLVKTSSGKIARAANRDRLLGGHLE